MGKCMAVDDKDNSDGKIQVIFLNTFSNIYLIRCFIDANTENVNEDCEVHTYAEDDNENEEQWRKMRFERENYLQKVVCILF